MNKICSFIMVVAVTLSSTGCYYHYSRSSGWSVSNLKDSTNMVQSGTIPASLKSLEVRNAFGAIHITGSDNAPGHWSQSLTVRAQTESVLQELAGQLKCKAELQGDHLTLEVTVPDTSDAHSFQSDLEITVPKSVAVQSQDQYGKTEISGLNADVDAASKFGAMELRDITGKVRGETSYAKLKIGATGPATLKNQFGAIEADDIRGALEGETSYGPLEARDIGGTVKLKNQFGRLFVERAGDANLRTSYGELSVKNITGDAHMVNQFGRLSAEDVSGSVKAETSYGPMEITGAGSNFVCDNQFGRISVQATSLTLASLEARTSYGPLEVRLPASLHPTLQAHTTYADIDSDFPVLMKSGEQAESSAAPRVNLRNQNGKIRVESLK